MAKKRRVSFLADIVRFVTKQYGEEKGTAIMQMAWMRYEDICQENKDEPVVLDIHTKQRIYPGIAIFDSLMAYGTNREEAAKLIYDYYEWRSTGMAKKIKMIFKIPGLYKVIPSFFTKMTKKMFGSEAGFVSKLYDVPKNEMRFDMLVCPYYEICKRYGCPEIVTAYCHADDICYGDMHPKAIWGRTKTLGEGADCCDFKIILR